MEKAYLLLEDGTLFEGRLLGCAGTVIGEAVFNTGMTGYQEILTDPSYHGQIVVQTYPLIGNYGINFDDFESSRCRVKGYVVRECCSEPSNFRSRMTLEEYLKKEGVTGICGIDTRKLTRIIREKGVMNAAITTDLSLLADESFKQKIKSHKIENAVRAVTSKEPAVYGALEARFNVVLMDYGYKRNIAQSLVKRGCKVTVMPAYTEPQKIIDLKPDGIMLSNGPGDPAVNAEIIKGLAVLYDSGIPIFGICLGHQLMALAKGAKTAKLKYGHRGSNHPVKDLQADRTYITSQNHGYAVLAETVDTNIGKISHVSMNDGTVVGIRYKSAPVFTVQFHPEASPGPSDTAYLFDEFISMMERGGKNA